MCKFPVGEGAIRTLTVILLFPYLYKSSLYAGLSFYASYELWCRSKISRMIGLSIAKS